MLFDEFLALGEEATGTHRRVVDTVPLNGWIISTISVTMELLLAALLAFSKDGFAQGDLVR
ncbi:hypothetical protein [Castellaniella sp.]|uniref:hypothetical protein n=1 Tax=Castellaniella sp. TaxID=1955812 RepID=UPI002AFF7B92|nr:hypothetical protein [Castellaniella sp.]